MIAENITEYSLERSDTGAHLGSCGNKYRPIQMEEMFDILNTASDRVGDIEHNGYTIAGEGKRVVVRSKLGDPIDVEGDKVDGFFYTVIDNTGIALINVLHLLVELNVIMLFTY